MLFIGPPVFTNRPLLYKYMQKYTILDYVPRMFMELSYAFQSVYIYIISLLTDINKKATRDDDQIVQISPQRMKLKLRKGEC